MQICKYKYLSQKSRNWVLKWLNSLMENLYATLLYIVNYLGLLDRLKDSRGLVFTLDGEEIYATSPIGDHPVKSEKKNTSKGNRRIYDYEPIGIYGEQSGSKFIELHKNHRLRYYQNILRKEISDFLRL